ncbi:hypothetical protein Tco_0845344 [Tanacetum coccineum]
MANIRTCNKHNMIACVEKTAQNADFYQIIDFLTGCSINLLSVGFIMILWPHGLQQFWATATLQVINDVPHIRAKVAGKKILVSEATIRADLLFDDENGVDCFPKQVIWDTLRDIGYEVLRVPHEQFGTQHRRCPRRSSTNPESNFFFVDTESKALSSHVRITPMTPSMLEVVTALAAEEEQSTSPHSRALRVYAGMRQGTQLKVLLILQSACLSQRSCFITKKLILEEKEASIVNMEKAEELDWRQLKVLLTRIRKKRVFDELRITKPKTTLRKPTSLLKKKRNQMMSFLKGQGYKNLQKLKYPQMKELYDKVQASIKDSFKDFVPMDSEKEREMLKERDAQRLSRKRKATITEEQPSKKPN